MNKKFPYEIELGIDNTTQDLTHVKVGKYIFSGQKGTILATRKLIPGIYVHENTPYGLFEPSGLIELSYEPSFANSIRFTFDPINYANDGRDIILDAVFSRMCIILDWYNNILNQ